MVRHIHLTVDDELAERGEAVKDTNGWTWNELFENAVVHFEEGDEDESG